MYVALGAEEVNSIHHYCVIIFDVSELIWSGRPIPTSVPAGSQPCNHTQYIGCLGPLGALRMALPLALPMATIKFQHTALDKHLTSIWLPSVDDMVAVHGDYHDARVRRRTENLGHPQSRPAFCPVQPCYLAYRNLRVDMAPQARTEIRYCLGRRYIVGCHLCVGLVHTHTHTHSFHTRMISRLSRTVA